MQPKKPNEKYVDWMPSQHARYPVSAFSNQGMFNVHFTQSFHFQTSTEKQVFMHLT